MAENYFIAVVKNNDRWAYWVGLGIPTEGKMYEDFQVHRLNSNDANELAKAEKLAKDFVSELNLRGVKKINHSIDYILDPYAVREDL